MPLTSNNLIDLCNLAIDAAHEAGKIISSYAGKQVKMQQKNGGSSLASQVVTEVDIKSENKILEILLPSCKEFNLALLTEETTDDKSRFEKEFFWCIDPLDGTLPYTENIAGYSVSIALVSKVGEPVIGVIYDPYNNITYHAVLNNGAFKNGKEWQLQQENDKGLTFAHNRSLFDDVRYDSILNNLKEVSSKQYGGDLKVISQGGAAMNAVWALENAPSCYFAFPKPKDGGGSLWDYAATACIYKEIGAHVSDIHGNALELNRVESTFMNHKGVLYASRSELVELVQSFYGKK